MLRAQEPEGFGQYLGCRVPLLWTEISGDVPGSLPVFGGHTPAVVPITPVHHCSLHSPHLLHLLRQLPAPHLSSASKDGERDTSRTGAQHRSWNLPEERKTPDGGGRLLFLRSITSFTGTSALTSLWTFFQRSNAIRLTEDGRSIRPRRSTIIEEVQNMWDRSGSKGDLEGCLQLRTRA